MEKYIFMAFVDLEKAFDRVPRKHVWAALRRFNVPEKLITMYQTMYENTQAQVRQEGELSETAQTNNGVRQGGI